MLHVSRPGYRAEAATRERDIAEHARQEAQGTLLAARGKLDKDAQAARQALEARTQDIARSVAKKILGREVA